MNQSKVCFIVAVSSLVGIAVGYCGCYVTQSPDVTLRVTAIVEPVGTPPTVKMPRAEEQQPVVKEDNTGLVLYEIKDGYGAKWNGVRITGAEDIPNFQDRLDSAIHAKLSELGMPRFMLECKEAKQLEEWYKLFNCAAWLFATRKSAGKDAKMVDDAFEYMTRHMKYDLEQLNKMLIDGIETGDVEKIAECRIRIDGTEAILREVERIRDTVK